MRTTPPSITDCTSSRLAPALDHALDPALDTALRCAAAGIPVLPDRPGTKAAVLAWEIQPTAWPAGVPWVPKPPTADRDTVLEYSRISRRYLARRGDHRPCNWGAWLSGSGIVVLDLDHATPADLVALGDAGVPLAAAVTSGRDPAPGLAPPRHAWCAYSGPPIPFALHSPDGRRIGEVKSSGQVILPGSIHASGRTYSADDGWDPAELPELPERAAAAIRAWHAAAHQAAAGVPSGTPARAIGRTSPAGRRDLPAIIPDGSRGEAVFRALCGDRARGADDHQVADRAAEMNARCAPPMDAARVAGIVASVCRYSPGVLADETEHPPAPGFADAIRRAAEWNNTGALAASWPRSWRTGSIVLAAVIERAAVVGSTTVHPGITGLCVATGFGRPTIARWLGRLADAGLVELTPPAPAAPGQHPRAASIDLAGLMDRTEHVTGSGCGVVGGCSAKSISLAPARHDAAIHPASAHRRGVDADTGEVLDVPRAGAVGEAWAALPASKRGGVARGVLGAAVLGALAELGEATAAELAALVGCGWRTASRHLVAAAGAGIVQTTGTRSDGGRPAAVFGLAVDRQHALGTGGTLCRALVERRREQGEAVRAWYEQRRQRHAVDVGGIPDGSSIPPTANKGGQPVAVLDPSGINSTSTRRPYARPVLRVLPAKFRPTGDPSVIPCPACGRARSRAADWATVPCPYCKTMAAALVWAVAS